MKSQIKRSLIRPIITSLMIGLFQACGSFLNSDSSSSDSPAGTDSSNPSQIDPIHQYHCTKTGKKVYIDTTGTYFDAATYVDAVSGKKISARRYHCFEG